MSAFRRDLGNLVKCLEMKCLAILIKETSFFQVKSKTISVDRDVKQFDEL
jgi:hypothetical protein